MKILSVKAWSGFSWKTWFVFNIWVGFWPFYCSCYWYCWTMYWLLHLLWQTALFDTYSYSRFSIWSRFLSSTEIDSTFSNRLISLRMFEYCFLCSTLWLTFSGETTLSFKSSWQMKEADYLTSVAFLDTAWFWLIQSLFPNL